MKDTVKSIIIFGIVGTLAGTFMQPPVSYFLVFISGLGILSSLGMLLFSAVSDRIEHLRKADKKDEKKND